MSVANILIGLGLVFVAAGLGGLVYCINLAHRIKTMNPSEDEIKEAFHKLPLINMASMGAASMGLALVLAGLIIN